MMRRLDAVLPIAAALTVGAFAMVLSAEIRQKQRIELTNMLASTAGEFGTALEERLRARLDIAYLLRDAIETQRGAAMAVMPELAATLYARSSDLQALNWVNTAGVIQIVVPLEGNEAAVGLDVSALPVPSQTLQEATKARMLRVSAPITLKQGGRGFVAYLPVFEGRLIGYVNAVFRTQPLIDAIAANQLDNRVSVVVGDGGATVWDFGAPAAPSGPDQHRVIDVGQRSWDIAVQPTAAGIAAFDSLLDELIIVFGSILALAMGGVVHFALKAQARFLDREELFALTVKGVTDGVFDWNAETDATYYSPRWFQMLGYEPGEFKPELETFLSLLHPDDEPRMRAKREQLAFSESNDEDEFRMRHKNGGWVDILSRSVVMRESGKVKRIVGSHVDVTELRRHQKELELAATTDELTGLRNRRGLTVELRTQANKLKLMERLLILHVDLDFFKAINDTHGHDAGDLALRETARRLLADPADFDVIARVGGDEFLLAKRFSGITEKALTIANSTIARLSDSVSYKADSCRMGATIGVAFIEREDGVDAETAIKHADIALGAAKRRGRGSALVFSEEFQREAVNSAGLMSEIEASLESGDFVSYFQPQINLLDGRVTGFEALARWQHPKRGLLSGGDFVPIAEEGNLIRAIDMIVLGQACDLAGRLPGLGLPKATVSVNVSTSQLMRPDLVENMKSLLMRHNTAPCQVRLEILESTLLSERTRYVADNIRQLAVLGFRMDLDDFGTGHAAIASLLNFPIARVKIDRSLITEIEHDPRKQAIARAIVEMANSLSIEVLAEGVETLAEVACLRDTGCQSLQGYIVAPPLPAAAIAEFLAQPDRRSARV